MFFFAGEKLHPLEILNPFYDASFKYLFQDPESARLLLEVVTGYKILELKTMGQEYYRPRPESSASTEPEATGTDESTDPTIPEVLEESRLDFVCRIVDETHRERICLVEVQRKSTNQQIRRFRRYLAFHYASDYNLNGEEPVEIMTLFFVGNHLPGLRDRPLVKVDRKLIDRFDGAEFSLADNDFVEKLTHVMYIVGVRALEQYQRTIPERVLQIFNQKRMSSVSSLEIDPQTFPKPFTRLLERLRLDDNKKIGSLRSLIEAEAEFEQQLDRATDDLKRAEAKIKRAEAEAKRAEAEAKRAEAKTKRAEAKTKRAEAEAKRAEAEAKRERKEKRQTQRVFAELLLGTGKTIAEAAATMKISEAEIRSLLREDEHSPEE